MESVSRGCTSSIDQMLLICNKQLPPRIIQNDNKKRHVSGSLKGVQYYVECCQTDFCNGGPFPILHGFNGGKIYIYIYNVASYSNFIYIFISYNLFSILIFF